MKKPKYIFKEKELLDQLTRVESYDGVHIYLRPGGFLCKINKKALAPQMSEGFTNR